MALLDEEDAVLRGYLHMLVGPNGDIGPLYRKWYDLEREEHDRTMIHMLRELSRRERNHEGRPKLSSTDG
jgi:hypothetical protein